MTCQLPGAERPRPVDEQPLLHRQHLGPDEARRRRPRRDADDEDDVPHRRPSTAASTIASGRNGMTRNQSVRRISTDSVRPPKKPGDDPDDRADDDREHVATSPTNRLTARAPDELGGDAAPEVVGPQRELAARVAPTPGCRPSRRRSVRRCRADQRGEQRHRHEQEQHDQADHRQPVAGRNRRPRSATRRPTAAHARRTARR